MVWHVINKNGRAGLPIRWMAIAGMVGVLAPLSPAWANPMLERQQSVPAQPLKVFIDGQVLYDHGGRVPVVIDSIIPKIQIEFQHSQLLGPETVMLSFSERPDLVSPTIDSAGWTLDRRNNRAIYQVPFAEASILYPGDQWMELVVRRNSPKVAKLRLFFAVGAHNLFSGLRGNAG